jgi:protein-disulfide isomerase
MTSFHAAKVGVLATVLALLLVAGSFQSARAQDAAAVGAYTPQEQARLESLVRDYLLRNPEVVIEAIQEFQRRQQRLEAEAKARFLEEQRAAIFEHPESPAMGEGSIAIVEFFDYRCPYCKRMAADLQKMVKANDDVRLVFKELPVLGEDSFVAAKWALAVDRQGKYEDYHFALMTQPGDLSVARLSALAESLGVDLARLETDLADPAIEQELQRTQALSQGLGVSGTPAFVIGDTMIPGAVPVAQLEQLIQELRKSGS